MFKLNLCKGYRSAKTKMTSFKLRGLLLFGLLLNFHVNLIFASDLYMLGEALEKSPDAVNLAIQSPVVIDRKGSNLKPAGLKLCEESSDSEFSEDENEEIINETVQVDESSSIVEGEEASQEDNAVSQERDQVDINEEVSNAEVHDKAMKKVRFNLDESESENKKEKEGRIDRYLFEKNRKHQAKVDFFSLPWTKDHYLPAYKAAMNSNMNLLKRIARYNVNFDKADLKTGEYPLHAAYRRGDFDIINFIQSKVKGNCAPLNRAGNTPFHVAVTEGNEELIAAILRTGNLERYKINQPNNYGRIPIMTAALNHHATIFKMLKVAAHQDYLHKDKNGRSLVSLLGPENPVYKPVLSYLALDLEKDRAELIRKIASDISFLFREKSVIDGKRRAMEILNRLGISLEEMITTPQKHESNLLMAILDSNDFVLYRQFRNDPIFKFDINAPNDYDDHSFFDRCVELAHVSSVEYLIQHENPIVTMSSFESVFKTDRVQVLKLLPKPADINGFSLIIRAGQEMANKCFKYLLRQHMRNGAFVNGNNLFCKAAVRICENGNVSSIKNIFDNFEVAMRTCSIDEILQMNRILRHVADSDGSLKAYLKKLIIEKGMHLFKLS